MLAGRPASGIGLGKYSSGASEARMAKRACHKGEAASTQKAFLEGTKLEDMPQLSGGLTGAQVTDLNAIAAFLARRDLTELTSEALAAAYGVPRVDLLILLGNSLLLVTEEAARVYRKGLARKILISGGVGHSTEHLQNAVRGHPHYRNVGVDGRCEADILRDVLVGHLGVRAADVYVERNSTNCGANARESLRVTDRLGLRPQYVLLMQDPTMQRRTHAAFELEWADSPVQLISYAACVPRVVPHPELFRFVCPTGDCWEKDRFLALVMGEVPRLRDDEEGYGPRGKGFIPHVDIPKQVLAAYERLEPVLRPYLRQRW